MFMDGLNNGYFCPVDTMALIFLCDQFPTGKVKFYEFCFQPGGVNTKVDHCAQVHVTAYSGEAVVVKDCHSVVMLYK